MAESHDQAPEIQEQTQETIAVDVYDLAGYPTETASTGVESSSKDAAVASTTITSSREPGQVAQRSTKWVEPARNEIDVTEDEEKLQPNPLGLAGSTASRSSDAGIVLAPQSREARIKHKQRQQQQQPGSAGASTSTAASAPSTNMTLSRIANDHQAAVALARQDIQAKSVPSNPQRTPVGAFRIVTSASGRFAISNVAVETDVLDETSYHPYVTPTTHMTTSLPSVAEAFNAPLVIESVLVVQEDAENPSSRRRTSRSNQTTTTRSDPEYATNQAALEAPRGASLQAPSCQHENGVILVTAQAPTLNDSVWALLKSRKGRIGVFILISLVATTFTALGVTVWNSSKAKLSEETINQAQEPSPASSFLPSVSVTPTNSPTRQPTTATPTAMPTSRSFRPLDALAEETISAILNDSSSPQAKAWAWLQEDIRHRTGQSAPNLASRRQLFPNSSMAMADQFTQRFVLVTLYYASDGAGWEYQRFWLDHDTSECDWWPHTTGVTWPYEQGPVVCHVNGSFAELLMTNNGLDVGPLPKELGMLYHLTKIDTSGNPGLIGAIPEPICKAMQKESDPLQVIMTCHGNLTCDCGYQCM
jgi:hypothetical protein